MGEGKGGWSERTGSKHVYYQVWSRSPAQVGRMRQVLRADVLGWPRGMGWGGRWEGGSGWGAHVNPWLIHVNVWQKALQYCKVIRLQLIKINEKTNYSHHAVHYILRTNSESLCSLTNILLFLPPSNPWQPTSNIQHSVSLSLKGFLILHK